MRCLPRLQSDQVPKSRLRDSAGQQSLDVISMLALVHTATVQCGPAASSSVVHVLIKQGSVSDLRNEYATALIPACCFSELHVPGPTAG